MAPRQQVLEAGGWNQGSASQRPSSGSVHLTSRANLTQKGSPRRDTGAAAWSCQRQSPPPPVRLTGPRLTEPGWGLGRPFGCPHSSRKGTSALSITTHPEPPALGTHLATLKESPALAPPAATGTLAPWWPPTAAQHQEQTPTGSLPVACQRCPVRDQTGQSGDRPAERKPPKHRPGGRTGRGRLPVCGRVSAGAPFLPGLALLCALHSGATVGGEAQP